MRVTAIMRKIEELRAQDQKEVQPQIILPPVDSLLRFAVRGWTDAHDVPCELGETVPRMEVWVPPFIAMMANPDWPIAWRNYAMRGALLYGGNTELVGCIARAFHRPDTRIRLVYELARRVHERWA